MAIFLNKIFIVFGFSILLLRDPSFAESVRGHNKGKGFSFIRSVPKVSSLFSVAPPTFGTEIKKVVIKTGCFGGNLRFFTPVQKESTLELKLNIVGNNVVYPVTIQYPSIIHFNMSPDHSSAIVNCQNCPSRPTVRMTRGLLEVIFRGLKVVPPSNSDGLYEYPDFDNSSHGPMFSVDFQGIRQIFSSPSSSTFSIDENLPRHPAGHQVSLSQSADFKTTTIDLKITAPLYAGESPGCYSYISPLVLAFEESDIPKFNKVVPFNLLNVHTSSSLEFYHWPEIKNRIFFLGLDKNKNNKIDDGGELFGNDNDHENGFVKLAKYDLNNDKLIDHQDPVFSDLILWNDKNSNGISEPNELMYLKYLNITSLDLRYVNHQFKIGQFAEIRQRSSFTFQKNKGEVNKGFIYDVWLVPANKKDKVTLTSRRKTVGE